MTNEKLVAYCGLYCPKCYKNVVSDAATKLKWALQNTHICNKPYAVSPSFKRALDKLIGLHCSVTCKNGGGKPNCAIKKCCKEKNINGCWECDDYKKCEKLHERFVKNIGEIKKLGLKKYIKSIVPLGTSDNSQAL